MSRLTAILLLSSLLLTRVSGAAEIIVHRDLEPFDMTRTIARLVFTMRLLRWHDGTRVKVFVLPDSNATHKEFAKRSLGLYPRQLRRVWDRHLFSGAGAVPTEVDTVDEMIRRVAETPGAVGYVPDGVSWGKVRVIHVD